MATATVLLMCPAARHGRYIGAAPADVESRNDVDPVYSVGGLYGTVGKTYMYVKFDNGDAVAAAAGQAAYILSLAAWAPNSGLATVTSDASGGVAADADAVIVGVFVNVLTDGYYGFIQTAGMKTGVLTDADAAGDRLIGSATDGLLADSSASAAVVEYVGIAIAAAA